MQKHVANPNVIGDLSAQVPCPYPDDGAQSWFDVLRSRIAAGEVHTWVLVPKAGPDEAIGVIDYRVHAGDDGHRGFWLAEPWWGRGLMTEAVFATQDWGFFELGVDEFVVRDAASNLRSRRLKEKVGAVKLDEFDLPHRHHGTRTERWRITAEPWAARRNRGS